MRDTCAIDGKTYKLTPEQAIEYERLRSIWEAEIDERWAATPPSDGMTLDDGRDIFADITQRFRESVRKMLGIAGAAV